MPKKVTFNPDEIAIFYQTVTGVKPLKQEKVRLASPLLNQQTRISKEIATFNFRESQEIDAVFSESYLSYKQASVSNKTLRKLRKGQYNVAAVLDLHGLTVEEARQAVEHFLQDCLANRLRVVLIIHGKGHHSQMPILKNKLNLWLREVKEVLAFCGATPTHGSRGAMYVLLKNTGGDFE